MTDSLVVLTDFYAVTNRALSYAAGLAVPLRAHLLLLHTRRDALLAPADDGNRVVNRPDERHTAYAMQALATKQPVPTEVDISEEALPAAVREVVRHRHPLLLVLGRLDSALAAEELVADTALGLLRHAPYPLLLVPGAGWDAFPPRRLLLALDGEPFSLRPHQDVLRRLLAATGGTLDVVHVADDGHASPGPAVLLGTLRENDLADDVPASRLHRVHHATVLGGILQEAARHEADMLVVVARPHGLLGRLFHDSITGRLLRESPIPVLVLPAEG